MLFTAFAAHLTKLTTSRSENFRRAAVYCTAALLGVFILCMLIGVTTTSRSEADLLRDAAPLGYVMPKLPENVEYRGHFLHTDDAGQPLQLRLDFAWQNQAFYLRLCIQPPEDREIIPFDAADRDGLAAVLGSRASPVPYFAAEGLYFTVNPKDMARFPKTLAGIVLELMSGY